MPTAGSITKTIRINPSDIAVLEGIMRENGVSWSGAIHELVCEKGVPQESKGVPQNNMKFAEGCTPKTENLQKGVYPEIGNKGVPQEFSNLVRCLSMDEGTFFAEIIRLINDGSIMKEGNELVARENGVVLDELFEVCKEANLKPQDAISKMIQGIRKGR